MKKIVFALIALVVMLPVYGAKSPTMTEAKVADSYHNFKEWLTLELMQKECPDLIEMYGIQRTRLIVLGITSIEAKGISTSVNEPELAYGPLHIRPNMYADYFRQNPNAPRFDHAELKEQGKEHLSLRILNWYATKSGYDHCGKLTSTVRCWAGGPDGDKPAKSDADAETRARKEDELAKTAQYAEDFLFAFDAGREFEETGVSIIM